MGLVLHHPWISLQPCVAIMVLEGTVKVKGFAGEHLLLWGSNPSALVVLVGMNPAGLRCLPAKVMFMSWLCPGAEEQRMLFALGQACVH